MASNNSVVTDALRTKLAQITAGTISALPKVKWIDVGSGGIDSSGSPKSPDGAATALEHKEGRYEVAEPEFPVPTTARFRITIPEADLAGKSLSEMALVSEDDVLYAIRNTTPKQKDSDEEFELVFDLEF